MPALRLLIAAGIALALADASVVTLALPPMLDDLDTTVEGVAAVIGVYTVVLAALLPLAASLRRRISDPALGAVGFGVFALAGALCSLPEELAPMLAFRALQAAGAALALVAGFALLRGGRLWTTAAVFGTAVGPALGGALTQAFDWRAIFLAQVPLALAAAAASMAARGEPGRAPVDRAGPGRALARRAAPAAPARSSPSPPCRRRSPACSSCSCCCSSRAGRSSRSRPRRPSRCCRSRRSRERGSAAAAPLRASAGCALVGAGVLALAVLPGSAPAWIVAPQVLAGVGMGMALPALAGGLLPERTPGQAAWLLSARHAGITLALLLIAPIAAAQLDGAVADVRERGAALMLDARLPPLDKLELAGPARRRPRPGRTRATRCARRSTPRPGASPTTPSSGASTPS